MSPRAGSRGVVLIAIVVAILLLGVVVVESQGGSAQTSTFTGSWMPPAVSTAGTAGLENLTQFVNPFVGTGDTNPCVAACGGDTFPGAAYPNGMVQWSPDTSSNPPGGYSYTDSIIKDLSLTHFSGRGCEVYQDFPFMPYVGKFTVSPAQTPSLYFSSFSHGQESARPGYYSVHLDGPNVTAELSVTPHTGVGRFVYPASTLSTMVINPGGSVNGNSNSAITVLPSQEEVTGSAGSVVGCGTNTYEVFFAAKFDRTFASYGTWNGDAVTSGSSSASGQHTGAFLIFDTTSNNSVDVQVAISFVSVANAQLNLASENARFNLESAASSAAGAWNARLNAIWVQGGTHNETVAFYTALYHAYFHPNIFNDDNGQYVGFDGKVHTVANGHIQYENIPGWDSYRTHMQLLSVLSPGTASDIAQSLVNDAQQGDGSLPRWEQANADSHGMSGDDGTVVVADAYAFGARGFNASAALDAMLNGQTQEREGYADYAKLGYVPADKYPGLSTASITLEYATDDFAISQFAGALGNSSVSAAYLLRSASWTNIYNSTSGYAQPRNADGSWAQGFAPASQNGFQEGNSAQYTWMVTFDLRGLFAKMGGNSTAVSRLEVALSQPNSGPNSPFAWIGNEPSVEMPWEYDFAQAPAVTQQTVRTIETQLWGDSPGGMPGNDDGGEMSSWYVFATMGLYPEIAGVGGFVVGSPLFTSVTVHLSGGHDLQIKAPAASDGSPYVQSLDINDAPASSLWVPWGTVQGGATLGFTLSGTPSTWGSSPQDAPPSFGAVG